MFDNTDFQTDTSDSDMMQPTDMMGDASVANQADGPSGMQKGSATRALVVLWFIALAGKWLLAYLFRGNILG